MGLSKAARSRKKCCGLRLMLFAIQMCLGDVVFSGQGAAVAKPELLTHT